MNEWMHVFLTVRKFSVKPSKRSFRKRQEPRREHTSKEIDHSSSNSDKGLLLSCAVLPSLHCPPLLSSLLLWGRGLDHSLTFCQGRVSWALLSVLWSVIGLLSLPLSLLLQVICMGLVVSGLDLLTPICPPYNLITSAMWFDFVEWINTKPICGGLNSVFSGPRLL